MGLETLKSLTINVTLAHEDQSDSDWLEGEGITREGADN